MRQIVVMVLALLVGENGIAAMPSSVSHRNPTDNATSASTAAGGEMGRSALRALRHGITRYLDPILRHMAFRNADVGIHVVRLSDGTELYAQHPDTLLVPASTVKIITTAAALHGMTASYQFPTEVYGTVDKTGSTVSDLYIKGYGDPYLVPERVWYLANRLYFLGIRTIRGDIVIDDSYFPGPIFANGAEQDTSSSAYMAPAGAVSVGFNTLRVHVAPGSKTGASASVQLEPLSQYPIIENHARTVAKGHTRLVVEVEPYQDRSIVRVSGQIHRKDNPHSYWRRIDNPALFAGEVFKHIVQQVGISVRGKVRQGTVAPTLPKLVTIYSPSLAELISQLNKHSNNFMAAQLAHALGALRYGSPGSWDNGYRAIQAFLENEVGIPAGTYRLGNASGLHDVNRLSARQIVQVLQYMYRQPKLWPEFAASLAVAGGSGTLQDRMNDTAAAYRLRGKTGTLSTASALSGYVATHEGDLLAFSLIVNNYKTDIQELWKAQDVLGSALADLQLVADPLAGGTAVDMPSMNDAPPFPVGLSTLPKMSLSPRTRHLPSSAPRPEATATTASP